MGPGAERLPGCSPIVPELMLAAQLNRYVDRLAVTTPAQRGGHSQERYVNLLVGLVEASQALNSSVAGDGVTGEDKLRSAITNLADVDLDALVFP